VTRFLADTNVWLALSIASHRHHRACLEWLDGIDEPGAVVMPRMVQLAVLRLVTTTAVLAPHGRPALTNDEAWAVIDAIAADERVTIEIEEPPLDPAWRSWTRRTTASPNLWMDAYLGAYATTAGYTLATLDAAFAQFQDLAWLNLAPT
jgi:toxin-antitoxin system PIN domain toxin